MIYKGDDFKKIFFTKWPDIFNSVLSIIVGLILICILAVQFKVHCTYRGKLEDKISAIREKY